MKKNYTACLLFVLLSLASLSSLGQSSGIYQSFVIIDSGITNNYYDLNPHTQTFNFDFDAAFLGTFGPQNNTFILNGGQNEVYKCPPDDITSTWLNYRIYPSGNTPGVFSSINLNSNVYNISGASCSGGQNQQWVTNNAGINILDGLTTGDYTLEVYTHSDFTVFGAAQSDPHYVNNGGANFKATFRVDTVQPVISCPSDIINSSTNTGQCSAIVSYVTPIGTDNFPGAITTQTTGLASGSAFPIGTTINTFEVTDTAGNTQSCSFSVTVVDIENPTISCPGNIVVTNDTTSCGVLINYNSPVISDNCPDAILVQIAGLASGSAFPVGVTTNTFRVTDSSGNFEECSFNVTVIDAASAASFSIDASATVICQNTPVTFTPNPTNAGSYEWFVNGISQGVSPTFIASTLANGDQVTAELTSNLSTCGTKVRSSNAINMTVNDTANVQFTISGPSTICSRQSATYNYQSISNVGANPTLRWLVNGIPSGATGATFTTTTLSAGDVISLEITSNVQCANPVPAFSTNTITISINPDATITNSASNDRSTCINTSITPIEFTIGGGGTGATVTGLPAGITASYNNGLFIISGSTNVAGTFPYTVITNGSCAQASTTGVITVIPNASLTLNTGNNNQTLCANASITTIQYTIGGSGNNATVTGLPAGFTVDYNSNILTISGSSSATGTFPFTVTATGTCANAASTGNIRINPILAPSVTITSSDGDNTICAGESVTFTANIANGGSSPIYQWNVNGANVGGNSATYTTTALTNGQTVTVDVTSNAPCVSPTLVTSSGITTTVLPNVTPSVSISSNIAGNTICNGSTINFTATPTNGGSNPTYQWQVNGSNVRTGPTFSSSTLSNGNTVRVIMASNATCVSTSTATSNVITMVVNPILTPSVTIVSSVPSNNICTGTSVTFTATPMNGGTSPSYQWQVNDVNVGTNSATYVTTGLSNGASVRVIITSNVPCTTGGNANATSNSITTTVFSSTPAAAVIDGQSSVCPPVTVGYSIPADPNVVTYTWSTSSPAISIGTGQGTNQITVNYGNVTGTGHYVRVITTNPCGSTTNTLPITYGTFAYVNAGPDQYICMNTTPFQIQLAGSRGGVVGSNDWAWSSSVNGGSFSNGGNSLNGTYTLPNGTLPGSVITITISTTRNVTNGTCTGNGSIVTDTMDIFVLPNPTASISVTGANPICAGSTSQVTFGATGYPNTPLVLSYNVGGGAPQTINLTTNGSGVATSTLTTAPLNVNTTYNLVSIRYAIPSSPIVCSQNLTTNATITVNPNATISTPVNRNQTICVNTAIAPINFTVGGGGAGATVSGLPTGVTGTFASGAFTISGTPNISGTFNYTVSTTAGSCTQTSNTGTLTVNPAATINNPANKNPIVCINNAIAPINFNVGGGGTNATVSGLPTGVTGSFASGVFTISGSPSVAGNFNYTVTTTGTCAQTTETGIITVNPNAAISNPANKNPIVCINNPITPINFSVSGGGTNASVSALPSGITGSFSGGIFTISGTPTVSGTFPYTVSTTGTCAQTTANGTITVNPDATISSPANKDQIVCANSSITPISFVVGGGGTNASITGLPSGVIGNYSSGTFSITGTPTVSGSFSYVVTTIGTCTQTSASGTLTVDPPATVTVGSNQTICSNQTASVVATLGGAATNGTWTTSGTGNYNSPTSISTFYTPSAADISSGNVTLTFTTNDPASPCNAASNFLVLTIQKQVNISTQPQNMGVCVSNPATLSVIASGDNLTYQWFKVPSTALTNTANISGVTTANLSFASTTTGDAGQYYVVIGGNTACAPVQSNTVSLNVNSTINITSQPTSLTICEGNLASFTVSSTGSTPTYQWYKTGSPNIALVNGGGISGATTNNLQIAGVSTANAGNYYVVITGSGGTCPNVTSSIVNLSVTQIPTANISYSGTPFCTDSGPQTVNRTGTNAYTGGTYTYNVISGGPTLALNASNGTITPSTSSSGTYTVIYTIPAAGGCNSQTVNTTVTISAKPTANISYSNTSYCETASTPINVTLTGTNAYTGGTFTTSPAGLSINATSGQIIANTSTVGSYTVTYTIPAANGCSQVTANTTLTISRLPVTTFTYNSTQYCTTGTTPVLTFTGGGTAGNFTATPSGLSLNSSTGAINLAASSAGTYTVTNTIPAASGCPTVQSSQSFTVFNVAVGGNITGYLNSSPTIISNNIMACQEGSGIFTLNGQTGNIIRWESSTNGGQTWTTIANTSNTLNFNSVTSTTLYRVVLQNGPCSLQYSAIALVNIIPTNIRPTVTPSALQTVCYGTNVNYTSTSGYGTGQFIQGGNFNNSNPAGWKVDGISHLPASGSSTSSGPWSIATGPRTFNSTTYNSSDNKFVITSGNFISNLETPVFNTFGLTTATVQFYQAYVLTAGAQAIIELSLDGGATYNINLSTINGAAAAGPYNGFGYTSIDLQNYIGQPNLRIRFRYVGTTGSSWALDNFILPSAPINETIQWIDINGNELSTTGSFSYAPPSPGLHTFGVTSLINGCRSLGPDGTAYVNVAANLAYAGKDIAPLLGECGENTVTLNAYDNTLTASQNIANGAFENNYGTGTNPGTGAGGTWSVDSGPATCGGTPSFSSLNNPRATFTGPAGTYTLRWTVAGCSSTVQVTLNDCQTVDFDGFDDYVTFGNTYNRGNNFSIEAWIKPESVSGNQTILSKRDGNINGDGYDLRLNGTTLSFNWNTTGTISSPYPLTTNRWYHIAITFGGGTYRLYIDGIQVNTSGGSAPSSNTLKFLLGAMDQTGNPPNKPIRYFRGWMDEVRLWNKTITQEQIRQMMNQEIRNNGAVAGQVVPLDVSGLNWTDLDGYYRMDIGCGALQPFAGTATGKLRNITSVQPQTAPIPYTSNVSGQNWETNSTWTNFAVWDAPNSIGIDGTTRIDWNIVRTSHDIISDNRDLTLLGLLVDANELIISGAGPQDETNNGTGLLITHYLKIDGKIDLVGESQLVQDKYTPTQISESFFDSTSAGIIERDQQGTGNPFNYNYWGSPVAPGNASVTSSNVSTNNYTISGILRAGTNTIPDPLNNAPINWIGGQTAVFGGGNNVQLSTRWLYTYANISNTYANWAYVGNSGAIKIGLGYSMKGNGTDPGPVTFNGAKQNYVFVGKPNNGTITNPIAINNDILAGNPYPSAIDANEFIKDNLPSFNPDGSPTSANNNSSQSINGTLYFWEHYQSNNSHVLREYIGGYATYSLGGGLEAVTPPPTVDGVQIVLGFNGTRRPERYVPVGQGFFVSANPEASGVANITFKNSQRIFKREVVTDDANDGSLFFRTTNSMADADADLPMKRVRLRFNSPEGAHRPLLLSFEPNNLATDGVDYGYDALNNDSFPSDLSWLIDGNGYVIQGVGEFNTTNQYPFAMKLAVSGLITITLTDLENFDESIDVYVYDSLLQAYHQINTMDFTMTLDAGNYDNRFYLTFAVGQTLSTTENEIDNVVVNYFQNTNEIYIKATNDIHIKQVYLINIIGQTIKSWNMTNIPLSEEIRIPTKNVSEGTYIIKVTTDKSIINKKAIIKY